MFTVNNIPNRKILSFFIAVLLVFSAVTTALLNIVEASDDYYEVVKEFSDGQGFINVYLCQDDNLPEIRLDNITIQSAEQLLSEEELQGVRNGDTAKILFSSENISSTLTKNRKKQIINMLCGDMSNGTKCNMFFMDVSIYKSVNNEDAVLVERDSLDIPVEVVIPQQLLNDNYNYHFGCFYNVTTGPLSGKNLDSKLNSGRTAFEFSDDMSGLYTFAYVHEDELPEDEIYGEKFEPAGADDGFVSGPACDCTPGGSVAPPGDVVKPGGSEAPPGDLSNPGGEPAGTDSPHDGTDKPDNSDSPNGDMVKPNGSDPSLDFLTKPVNPDEPDNHGQGDSNAPSKPGDSIDANNNQGTIVGTIDDFLPNVNLLSPANKTSYPNNTTTNSSKTNSNIISDSGSKYSVASNAYYETQNVGKSVKTDSSTASSTKVAPKTGNDKDLNMWLIVIILAVVSCGLAGISYIRKKQF